VLFVKNKLIGGILLVAGTTIGAAMLALPSVTGMAGFYPSLSLFIFYWAFFVFTALLMLEVTLWMEDNTNMITMAHRTLGRWGEVLSWFVYLFLLYSLTTAYLSGSSQIFIDFVRATTGYEAPAFLGPLPLLLIFGFFVYRGALFVDMANRWLMVGLAVTFIIAIVSLAPYIDHEKLAHTDWKFLLISNSVIVTSYGFHIIIPSLATYMHRDVKKLRTAILIGSSIPLLVYLLWEWVALGSIPVEGENGIIAGYHNDLNGAHLLTALIGNTWLSMVLRAFAFFAIMTSFLGVSLSLRDFLADGFHIEKNHMGKIKLYMMTFVPTLIFMWTNPRAFLSALEYAGAFGVMILLGFLPALMVYQGRYKKNFTSHYRVAGGKPALIFVMLISSLLVVLEIANKLGFANHIVNLKG